MPKTYIVIVNYRTPDMVVDSLASLEAQLDALGHGKVLVVDNHSGDGSDRRIADAIRERGWSDWAELLPQPRNGGFSAGNNAGIRRALALDPALDYILLLNPDTIARPDALRQLVLFMEQRPRAGIAGCRIENADGSVETSAHRMLSPRGELLESARLNLLSRLFGADPASQAPASQAHPCDWVSGAGLMMRRGVLDDIGEMDEGFFLYFEEVDYCHRAKQAGWDVWYAPAGAIVHLEGASTGIKVAARRRPAYWFASRRRFYVKTYGVGALFVADLLRLVGRSSYLVRKLLRLGQATRHDPTPPWFHYDMLRGDLKALLSGELRAIRP
jgi:N-acetylglucosaminyl-diphospho-decaprenol L-rhamnosyltransferase